MKRPLVIDLFCKAGGASYGYWLAGFDVIGVDIEPQPNYPKRPGMRFVQAEALSWLAENYHMGDVVAGSPPCQPFTSMKAFTTKDYPDLVDATRQAMIKTGLPYVIENVVGAPLINPITLCGTMFGVRTSCGAELRRHRLFETNWLLMVGLQCNHYSHARRTIHVVGHEANGAKKFGRPRTIMVVGDVPRDPAREWEKYNRRVITVTGHTPQQNVVHNEIRETFPVSAAREAMGIDWMVMRELSQAIPPKYTEFIGRQLLAALNRPTK